MAARPGGVQGSPTVADEADRGALVFSGHRAPNGTRRSVDPRFVRSKDVLPLAVSNAHLIHANGSNEPVAREDAFCRLVEQ